jgi:hypothetical protein
MPFPVFRSHLEQLAGRWRGLVGFSPRSAPGREPSHSLLPLETHWVDSQPGLQVTCLDGCLILTFAGEARDVILVRGESHACESSGRLAVQALVAADILLH